MYSRLLCTLGLGKHRAHAHHRIVLRSLHVSSAETTAAARHQTARTSSFFPNGRLYVPSGLHTAGQLPSSNAAQAVAVGRHQQRECVSITVQCPSDGARIVVINGAPSGGPASLSGTACAAAAGAWPTLPTWLFGFACGSAAATAMAYNYLRPQGAAAAASINHPSLTLSTSSVPHTSSSGSSSAAPLHLTDLSSFGDSSSSRASGVSGPQGIWGYLQQLGRLGAASAHAASSPPCPDNLLLPIPWEQADDSSSGAVAAAADASSDTAGDAVLMRSSISRAAAAAVPAVVHLVAAGAASSPTAAALVPGLLDSRAQGSGFIYDPRGYILTNAHVVLGTAPAAALSASTTTGGRGPRLQHSGSWRACADSSSSTAAGASPGGILVHLHDGRMFDGRLVALDCASDLAVVHVEAPAPLPACKLGNSHKLRLGEWVVALGSPFLLKQSVTAGIVSCVERKGSELGLPSPRTEFIQTDAAINVGNSGGPLVNLDGEVVGMNNMKAAAADGVSFAIPINTIKLLVAEISRHGRVRRPYVGITMAEVRPTRMAQLRTACPDFPADVAAGIVVTRVAPGSPAAAAGLREDDVIVGLQGARPDHLGPSSGLSVSSLSDALKDAIGSSLELLVVREQHAAAVAAIGKQQGRGGSNGSSTSRYAYVSVTVKPVEAPAL